MKVWLNGSLLEEDEARISPADRGLLLGDGVFETLRSYGGRLLSLDEHLERLAAGAGVLGIAVPTPEELAAGARALLAQSGLPDARLRITVTSGPGPAGLERREAAPTALIAATPLRAWPETAAGVLAPWPHDERSPLAGVKTTSRADSVLALAYARSQGADEALFLNGRGDVCEATTANVFAVVGERVLTPSIESGCLAGITREQVLRLCAELGIETVEAELPAAALDDADELFLTSSTRGVQALVALDGRKIGEGGAGPVTRSLAAAFTAMVQSELRT